MEKIRFHRLKLDERGDLLPCLFEILFVNMNPIAPIEESYEEALAGWVEVISKALENEKRAMVVIYDADELVGFFMYAVNRETGLFLMEEIQFRPSHRGSGLFHRLYGEVLPTLPPEVRTVEAYAHKRNLRSQGILAHLGLSVIGENRSGNSWHYRGEYGRMKSILRKEL